jgi:chromosome partitioning protein
MPTSIVTVANQKGGVGKTTSVVNLAASYANMGKRVLVVDMDSQGNATSLLGAEESARETGKETARAILDSLPLEEVILASNTEDVDILAGTKLLKDVKDRMEGKARQHLLLSSLLEGDALNKYDVVLIDTHPSFDCLLLSSLVASHYYMVPLFAEKSSISGFSELLSYCSDLRPLNPMLMLIGCVITKFDRSNATHVKFEKFVRDVGKSSKIRVFETLIPMSQSVAGSDAASQVLLKYKKNAPVTVAYTALAGETLPLLKGKRLGRMTTPNLAALEKLPSDFEAVPELSI